MEGWQPYADKVIAALEQYTPEAWRAVVAYKATQATVAVVACFTFGSVCIAISAFLLYRALRAEQSQRPNMEDPEPYVFALVPFAVGAIILTAFWVCWLPDAFNPEGALLLDVLRGVR